MIRRVVVVALLAIACSAQASEGGLPNGSTGAATAAGLLGIVYWLARELVATMRQHLGTVERSMDRLSVAVERAVNSRRATSPGEDRPDTGHDRAR